MIVLAKSDVVKCCRLIFVAEARFDDCPAIRAYLAPNASDIVGDSFTRVNSDEFFKIARMNGHKTYRRGGEWYEDRNGITFKLSEMSADGVPRLEI